MYDETFKKQIIEEKRNFRISCEELAQKYNVAVQSVYAWVREDRKKRMEQPLVFTDGNDPIDYMQRCVELKDRLDYIEFENRKKVEELETELSKLKEENEALKKTIEIFFKEKK